MMKDVYETLSQEKISLSSLRQDDKEFLSGVFKRFEEGSNYLSFKQTFLTSDSPVIAKPLKRGKEPEETPLYKVCSDLAVRLGIGQGYLVRDEVIYASGNNGTANRELTTGEVAKRAGCTTQAVRKAIFTARLRARKVGRMALISEDDATAFAHSVRPYRGRRKKIRSKEHSNA